MARGVSAVVLAGGRSTRFGADKASTLLRGEPLLQWVTRAVAGVVDDVVVVKAGGQALPVVREEVREVEDDFDALGPLAGMVTGFAASTEPLAFVVSCDAPLLESGLVEYLVSRAEGADVVLPVAGGFPQPLLAVYRVETCLPVFRSAVQLGELKLMSAIEAMHLRRVEEEAMRAIDADLRSFRNCNTPAALAEIEAMLGGDADLA